MNNLNKKIFIILFFSIFTAVTGVGIVVPLLPVYAHTLGGSGLYIGLIFGSFSLSRTFFLPYFGRSSDKRGRKPYIVTGLLCYAVISFSFILASSVEILIAIRFFQGIASAMIMPVTQAYVGDITPEKKEGVTMGLFNMSTFIGLSIGPMIGGLLNDHVNMNAAFISMGILSSIGFLLSLFLLPPARSEKVTAYRIKPVSWLYLLKDRYIDGIFIFRFVYTACIGIIWGFLPIYADSEFALSGSCIGFLVMTGIFTSGLLQTPVGYIADRGNKRLMIIMGGIIIIVSMFLYQWSGKFQDLFYASFLFGVGGSLSMAPLTAIAVQKGVQMKSMGAVMSVLTLGHSLGMMTGAFFAGILMDYYELRQIFLFGAGIMLTGVILFILFTVEKKSCSQVKIY
ncbi:Major facilitator superfamily transporter [Desulfonema limicola]|uniref:Major facilitator superfamily transporter n=1 Tax=Desulfonema limicola TaxID=45656 RepID=A0A975BD91_9BACT|nr:MFS transporter [Desulfonema limicola]QTA83392.1 Major facilitator superfamily transporter [Desulfonema limicola]